MCGIAAIFSKEKRNLAPSIQKMTDLIRHRGPDGEGFFLAAKAESPLFLSGKDTMREGWRKEIAYRPTISISEAAQIKSNVAFGHRRLSILDLSVTGHQPMSHEKASSTVITFNGEIYNYIELRQELLERGYSFISGTDTEVILKAYEEWGIDCLRRFNGMFAFVIYDRNKHEFFVARDRFGVKPLYYWRSPAGLLAFASEIKQFSALAEWRALLNHSRVYDYLAYGLTDHTEETLFRGVKQLRGGQMLLSSLDAVGSELNIKNWYQMAQTKVEPNIKDAAKSFKSIFSNAVSLRLRSDVPVGSALSGGLDSSSIVCTVSEILKKEKKGDLQNTFSARAEEARFDEGKFIDAVVEKSGAKLHNTYPQFSGLFQDLEKIVWAHDEPFASTSIFAEWNVYALVEKSNVKVTLDGHGADEILAGYHSFFFVYFRSLLFKGKWLLLLRELRAANKWHKYNWNVFLRRIFWQCIFPKAERARRQKKAQSTWLNFSRLKAEALNPYEEKENSCFATLKENSLVQLLCTSLPQQLKWGDRDSMAHSVESRMPFLDYRLVEFIVSCPDQYKIQNATTKFILREAMQGVLPDLICARKDKMGFVTPEEHWLKVEAPDQFLAAVELAVVRSKGILKTEAVQMVKDIIASKAAFSFLPFRMICFGAWVKEFSVEIE
jgi:asparagine synthase (glutamine-hydrolysing)